MTKIYTKKGDKGITSNYLGNKIQKDDSSLLMIGSIDEMNSFIGLSPFLHFNIFQRYWYNDKLNVVNQLNSIQCRLFELGSAISTNNKMKFNTEYVEELEIWIDNMDKILPPLKNFIYPRSNIQVSRAFCRRAERTCIEYGKVYIDNNSEYDLKEALEEWIKFLNRLSDYLFVLDRYYNYLVGNKETKFIKT